MLGMTQIPHIKGCSLKAVLERKGLERGVGSRGGGVIGVEARNELWRWRWDYSVIET